MTRLCLYLHAVTEQSSVKSLKHCTVISSCKPLIPKPFRLRSYFDHLATLLHVHGALKLVNQTAITLSSSLCDVCRI